MAIESAFARLELVESRTSTLLRLDGERHSDCLDSETTDHDQSIGMGRWVHGKAGKCGSVLDLR
jgi:hypothetical protein